jgi:hypothetical protein
LASRAEGMRARREAAVEKMLNGVTTIADMLRLTGT